MHTEYNEITILYMLVIGGQKGKVKLMKYVVNMVSLSYLSRPKQLLCCVLI